MNPLNQLADIVQPDAVSIWPLAWGYWLVVVLGLGLIGFGIFTILSYRTKRKAKREALQSLANLDRKNEHYAHNVQVLMKTLCAHYLPSYSSYQMHGEKWKSLILSIYEGKETANLNQAIDDIYYALYFPKNPNGPDIITLHEKIHSSISDWIKNSFPCKNQIGKPSSLNKIDDGAASGVSNV